MLEMLVMLLSDLPLFDDVKKGESYLGGEIFFVFCFVLDIIFCWTSFVLDMYF